MTRDTSVEDLAACFAQEDPKIWSTEIGVVARVLERVGLPANKAPAAERTNGVGRGYANFAWILTYEWNDILRVVWWGNEIHQIEIRSNKEGAWFTVYAWLRGHQGGPWWLLIGKVLSDILNEKQTLPPSAWIKAEPERWEARAKEFSEILLAPHHEERS